MDAVSRAGFAPSAPLPRPAVNAAFRESARDLAVALRQDDLAGAREAFAGLVKAAPEGAQWNPDSAYAAVGRALVKGDLAAAQEAAKAGLQAWRDQRGDQKGPDLPTPVPQPMPAPSSSGGTAGSVLNVVA